MKDPVTGKPDRAERPRARVSDARAKETQEAPAVTGEKLQKVLADRGYASRRAIEDWMRAGRVLVNGVAAHVGQRVSPSDRVLVDGVPLREASRDTARVLVLNKAAGVICTRADPEGRPTVFDALPRLSAGRWVAVGRLDFQSAGLLLVTNDGELANRLMHPRAGLDREYAVRVDGRLTDSEIERLKRGVQSDGEELRFSDIRHYDGSGLNHWYHVVLLEGRNREVRRLFEAVGRTVSRLKRVRYGPVFLPSTLRSGRHQALGDADIAALYRLVGLQAPRPGRSQRRGPGAREIPSLLLPYPNLSEAPSHKQRRRRSPDARQV
jgi:23S rRNA pseudouridine2605 synthase